MDKRKEMMEVALSESMRELMRRSLFEKITIKQICDRTGVIRATFYNHFEDKYDCLNWIIWHDLIEDNIPGEHNKEYAESVEDALKCIEKNKEFYKAAFNIIGQNSFEDMLRHNLKKYVKAYLDEYRKKDYLARYDNDLLAGYYANTLTYCVKVFVYDTGGKKTVSEIKQMILDLTHHSVTDFLIQTE